LIIIGVILSIPGAFFGFRRLISCCISLGVVGFIGGIFAGVRSTSLSISSSVSLSFGVNVFARCFAKTVAFSSSLLAQGDDDV
jgi:hypothetical protein